MKIAVHMVEDVPAMGELTRRKLETDLNIWEWGRWMGGGMPNNRRVEGPEPNISDDDALRMDKLVRQLPELVRTCVIDIYIYRKGIAEVASEFRSSNRGS